MKASMLSSIVVLGGIFANIVGGHPHKLKRDLVTEVSWTTVTVDNVIVYVDENGTPYETTTVNQVTTVQSTLVESTLTTSSVIESNPAPAETAALSTATPTPTLVAPIAPDIPVSSTQPATSPIVVVAASTAIESSSSSVVSSLNPYTPTPEPSSASPQLPPLYAPPPAASSPSPEPSVTPSPQASSNTDLFPIGVTYDPLAQNACKTEQEIRDEWSHMTNYRVIRIYGSTCGIIPLAVQLAKTNNQKIFAGIWASKDSSNENAQDVVNALSNAVKNYAGGDWSIISLVSVENEQVNDKTFTASEVVDAINKARSALRSAGYNGPVGAVETAPAMIDNPTICENSDIAMVNIHAFFDENTTAGNAGKFVQSEAARVKDACGGKRVVVTESGWPHQGDSNGAAVPSPANQKAAVDSILGIFDNDLFVFNAFDSPWKTDSAGSFNAERYWGTIN